ncbi:TPA: phosphatase PAP2 family protein [Morganella morganii]|nr:phosphatase PAP2 family protein [Morganella morganii]ELA7733878.1 phosphatase PAP2 family protein [Morganella morganii]QSA17364.1 phosphatase PAP2 family protein [Morganella morganii]HCR3775588.1 phosphatase PAP2 family protein [Morganella morganii]
MNTDPDPFSRRVISYLLWCIPVSVVFFTVYPLMNAYTAGRDSLYALWFPAELHIPFVPGFIWVYCSFYLIILMPVLFLPHREHRQLALTFMVMTLLGGVIFFLFPAQLGFVREVPESPLYRTMYMTLFALDHPHNLVPSLHVAWSCAAVLAIIRHTGRGLTLLFLLWLVLIVSSVLLVHQHHVADVVTGLLLAVTVSYMMRK